MSSDQSIYLLTLGRDRWVSYDAGEREGELLTAPLNWEVGKLNLNTTIEKGGYVKVEVWDELGNRLTRWGLDEIMPLEGPLDEIDATVRFRPLEPRTVFKFPTRGPVRLLFKMRRVKLYGWSFGE